MTTQTAIPKAKNQVIYQSIKKVRAYGGNNIAYRFYLFESKQVFWQGRTYKYVIAIGEYCRCETSCHQAIHIRMHTHTYMHILYTFVHTYIYIHTCR